MTELANMRCIPCRGDEPPASADEIESMLRDLPDWTVAEVDGTPRLHRTFQFPDFRSALAFTNRVGSAAEQEDHHPELVTGWGSVDVAWWTHKLNGLHQNDFIMAARTDRLAASPPLISGMHGMLYSSEAEAAREFLEEKLDLPAFDVGDGWLIFDLPAADLGCHPAEASEHQLSFQTEDIDATVATLLERGVEFTQEVEDYGWGKATFFKMPGGLKIELYEAQYDK